MRIAFDYQIYTQQRYGGISRYFTVLAQNLLELNQQVGIFAPLHCNAYLSYLPNGIVHGYGIGNYPKKTARLFHYLNNKIAVKKINNWQPSILHETFYSIQSNHFDDFPKVITVFDMIYELFKDDYNIKTYQPEIKKAALERADHILCISHNTKNDLIRLLGVAESKISVVLLGFENFENNKDTSDNTSTINCPFLLYVGNRDRYKNFTGMLKEVASSYRLLRDFRIVAFGGPKLNYLELSFAKSLGFRENQIKHVTGDDNQLQNYYKYASAFIFPSLYEGFGIPPLEAMANNCPVVSSNTSSMPEVIGNAAEFFDPYKNGDMCQAIEKVVYSESRIVELKKLGLERLSIFSWKKCALETLQIYKRLV